MEKIKIKYHDGVEPIEKLTIGDWIDLRAAENVFIPLNEFALISLGVSMKLPDGYEAHIVPRSSTFKTWGIIQTNHTGIVDNSYCGTNDVWKLPVFCLEERGELPDPSGENDTLLGTWIHKNDRICQFRIVKKQPEIEFEVVNHLNSKSRGGFGSTGVK
jgi:dUTP pyrophosphatase